MKIVILIVQMNASLHPCILLMCTNGRAAPLCSFLISELYINYITPSVPVISLRFPDIIHYN